MIIIDISTSTITSDFDGLFPGEPRLAGPPSISVSVCSRRHHLGTSEMGFFYKLGCPSCHPTNSVKALKETQSNDLNQENQA